MQVNILASTDIKEIICAIAAGTCYREGSIPTKDEVNKDEAEKLIRNCINFGHESVLEHLVVTFAIEGVSRVLTHQLVRHRIASFSQQSMRYVSLENLYDYIIPDEIQNNQDALLKYKHVMNVCHTIYCQLIEDFGIKPEDARYVLPNGAETKIVVTMNARELRHFFQLRCCNRAQKEIRDMACEMLTQCKLEFPIIFEDAGPPCLNGKCPEGSKSCGNPWSKK